ncbi:MAG: hypothetical protein AAFV19_06370 [Pseudomonadota bacterium]
MNIKFVGAMLLSVMVLAGCRAATVVQIENETYAVPASASASGLTLNDYKVAIIRAGVQRGWQFEEQGPGEMIGTINVRGKHTAKVRVLYDTSAFSIIYLDSTDLNYDAEVNEIHPNYNSWVQNLRQDIQAQVSLAKLG